MTPSAARLRGGSGGGRTHNLRVKSPLLCRLSYRPRHAKVASAAPPFISMEPYGVVGRLIAMITRLIPIIALGLVVTACGDSDTLGTPAEEPISGAIHVSGGIAGIDETWTLAADGTIAGPNGETGTYRDADLAALRQAIASADFFNLAATYMPDDTCCDRFTYEVTLTEGDRINTVTTIDAAEAPQTLFSLIDTFRNALRIDTSLP